MNKYCRICWNTLNWRLPSHDAKSLEWPDSYVADHGFGHEEWLFNFEWLLSGFDPNDTTKYRYGFLQPISKYHDAYIGQTFNILVYTVNPTGTRLAVARINDAYIPERQELNWAFERIRQNGWLDMMQQHIQDLGESVSPLINPSSSSIVNIRFRPEDVEFYHPMIPLHPPHVTTRINRYVAYDWDDGFQPTTPSPRTGIVPVFDDEDNTPDRSVAPRTRPAQSSITYDPQHSMLQNLLREVLRKRYGEKAVKMERDSVDLRYTDSGKTTFIEIKMEKIVKKCVRLALGQLLEYAHYPNLRKADTLLVVGDAEPNPSDKVYLKYIRDTYRLPIYYAQWFWINRDLGSWV
jgi:hypothetical protein